VDIGLDVGAQAIPGGDSFGPDDLVIDGGNERWRLTRWSTASRRA